MSGHSVFSASIMGLSSSSPIRPQNLQSPRTRKPEPPHWVVFTVCRSDSSLKDSAYFEGLWSARNTISYVQTWIECKIHEVRQCRSMAVAYCHWVFFTHGYHFQCSEHTGVFPNHVQFSIQFSKAPFTSPPLDIPPTREDRSIMHPWTKRSTRACTGVTMDAENMRYYRRPYPVKTSPTLKCNPDQDLNRY